MRDLDILIIGAGIGGLTAALALQRAGLRVQIYEKAAELGEVGAGVTITPNGSHALNHLLGADRMAWLGHVPASGAMRHYRTGATLVDTLRGDRPQRRYGAAYFQAHRADLHGALAHAVRLHDPECIHLGAEFVGLAEGQAQVTAQFADGRAASAALLVGCDGIRSAVRRALWGEETVSFTGYIAWRGLVPAAALEPQLLEPDSAAFVGPGRTFTRYKVRRGELINYVAFSRRDEWAEESWSVHADVSEVLNEFKDFCYEARAIIEATPPGQCFRWGLFDREPLAHWSRGRATLLGDAAHPMTPFLAQGAVMAIEDAMLLARALEASSEWPEALSRYEAARRERATLVMRESHVNARRMYSRDPDAYSSSSHTNAESLGLYAYNPVTVPV